eukprot:5053579-Pleurochrysis_carterae.AAC.1
MAAMEVAGDEAATATATAAATATASEVVAMAMVEAVLMVMVTESMTRMMMATAWAALRAASGVCAAWGTAGVLARSSAPMGWLS